MAERITIPARKGKATHLKAGDAIRVINTPGTQVVDTWAFNAADVAEFMSMEHSRTAMQRLTPKIGDTLVSNRRRPIMTLVEDTSGEVHDTLLAACDPARYQGLGVAGFHDNCQDNLWAAMREIGIEPPETPSPLNLFMNIPWDLAGGVDFKPPVSGPGSFVLLRAEMDLYVAFSACPQDFVPINGIGCAPSAAHFEVAAAGGF